MQKNKLDNLFLALNSLEIKYFDFYRSKRLNIEHSYFIVDTAKKTTKLNNFFFG
jgi:hypothetical protein